jgi:predicted nucleic acid-binding protein
VSFVLDAATTLSWYFEDEVSAAADALMDRMELEGAVVPPLWRYEVVNGFHMAIRRRRIDRAYRDASLAELGRMPIAIDRGGEDEAWVGALDLADRFGLTVYDAAYLELALRRGLPLATGDDKLTGAARLLAVAVFPSRD